jgi:glycine/serine hydroxymethyltransferase
MRREEMINQIVSTISPGNVDGPLAIALCEMDQEMLESFHSSFRDYSKEVDELSILAVPSPYLVQ